MKKIFATFGLLFAFLVSIAFAEDSPLVEAAKKEKERREKVKAVKTFTNQDVEEFKRKNKIEDEPEAPATEQSDAGQKETAEKKEEKDKADDEAYWRGRYASAQEQIKQAQERVNTLQSDVNALTRQFYAEGDGVAQRGVIQAERNSRLSELEQAKAELQQAQQAMQDLEEEARRAGALPGWIRD